VRKKEQLLWDAMKRKAPADFDFERIENLVGDGTPDLRGKRIGGPRELWVELKAPIIPLRPSSLFMGKSSGVRVSQEGWHLRYASFGGVSFILCRDQHKSLYLFCGSDAAEIKMWPLAEARKRNLASSWDGIFLAFERASQEQK